MTTPGSPRLRLTFSRCRWVERLILMSIGVIVGLTRSNILNSAWSKETPFDEVLIIHLPTSGASKAKGNDRTPRPSFAMKHGGMCPVKGCLLTKKVREAWFHDSAAADQAEAATGNDWTVIDFGAAPNFTMLTRNPHFDRFISGTLRAKKEHDPQVAKVIVHQLVQPLASGQSQHVFMDVGANIGYFTSNALALGAKVISFEPMRDNYGCIMATVRKNGWQGRHHLYLNLVSFEGATTNMRSTSTSINLSNGRIVKEECEGNETGLYGIDWMDSVSLDQVMLKMHPDVRHVQLMKVDVETFEVHVVNGAMRFLCNAVVSMIVMEVEYCKKSVTKDHPCNSTLMQNTLERMGYSTWSGIPDNGGTDLIGTPFDELPSDVIFCLKDQSRPPSESLRGSKNNPCEGFEI